MVISLVPCLMVRVLAAGSTEAARPVVPRFCQSACSFWWISAISDLVMIRIVRASRDFWSADIWPLATRRSPAARSEMAMRWAFLVSVSPGGMRRKKLWSVVVSVRGSPLSLWMTTCFSAALTAVTVPVTLVAAAGAWAIAQGPPTDKAKLMIARYFIGFFRG